VKKGEINKLLSNFSLHGIFIITIQSYFGTVDGITFNPKDIFSLTHSNITKVTLNQMMVHQSFTLNAFAFLPARY
jgi:hypothetical protein